ncbi:MAG TPA: hypothetical protein VNJ02_14615 [Vicinamibacterales bacterium]|nr:hypothetical protein [Vicinamibacterales bacterium]
MMQMIGGEQSAGNGRRTPALNIQAPPQLQPAARRISRVDAGAVLAIMRMIGIDDGGGQIEVVLAAEDSDAARSTPRWIAGYAHTESSTIVLFPARSLSYPHDSLEDVFLHEVGHILIGRAAGGAPVPRWFHEGLALTAERTPGLRDRTQLMLAVAFERRNIASLDESFAGGSAAATRAYALSGAMIRHVIRRHGHDAPARVLARLAGGERFDNAFHRATGESLAAAEAAFWRDSWWQQIIPFLTSTAVLWFGVILLALFARRTRAVRREALRRRWEEDERREQAAVTPDPPATSQSDPDAAI